MLIQRVTVLTVILVLALGVFGAAPVRAGEGGDRRDFKVEAQLRANQAYCPRVVLLFGNVVIRTGRCYSLWLLRDARGTFLAFADGNAKIPPGQLVRLNTPAGAKWRGRIFYLVPLNTPVTRIPLNAVTPVAARVERGSSNVVIFLPSLGANVSIVFRIGT